MTNLTRAHNELFKRAPDERFESLTALTQFCREKKENSVDHWQPPYAAKPVANGSLHLPLEGKSHRFNDWSFTQMCRLAGVSKETVNRLTPSTAAKVFDETLTVEGNKPLQILTDGEGVRSIHGTQYTRLWNLDILNIVHEFATDFQPPQKGFNGATGLYAGEQDMFCFLIDPLGWTEIGSDAFAPGFFVWNSEVGRRTVGVQTFWLQAVCQNHIVWDATEIVEWTRKHTARVHDGLSEIRTIIARLVEKRDERKDGFAKVIAKAMQERLGADADEVLKELTKKGFNRSLAKRATDLAREQGRFTIFSVVDALTRIARESENAGDRLEVDEKAATLLALAK